MLLIVVEYSRTGPIDPIRLAPVAHSAPPNTRAASLFLARPQACAGP